MKTAIFFNGRNRNTEMDNVALLLPQCSDSFAKADASIGVVLDMSAEQMRGDERHELFIWMIIINTLECKEEPRHARRLRVDGAKQKSSKLVSTGDIGMEESVEMRGVAHAVEGGVERFENNGLTFMIDERVVVHLELVSSSSHGKRVWKKDVNLKKKRTRKTKLGNDHDVIFDVIVT